MCRKRLVSEVMPALLGFLAHTRKIGNFTHQLDRSSLIFFHAVYKAHDLHWKTCLWTSLLSVTLASSTCAARHLLQCQLEDAEALESLVAELPKDSFGYAYPRSMARLSCEGILADSCSKWKNDSVGVCVPVIASWIWMCRSHIWKSSNLKNELSRN
jgi:hypothetical protein